MLNPYRAKKLLKYSGGYQFAKVSKDWLKEYADHEYTGKPRKPGWVEVKGHYGAPKTPKRQRQDSDSGTNVTPQKKIKTTVGLPEKKNMGKGNTQVKAQKKLVKRSSMVVTGKTKVKRVRAVKVPMRLRKQIKAVMSSGTAHGTYITNKSGFIGSVTGAGTIGGGFSGDDLNKTQTQVFFNGAGGLAGRTLFNQLIDFRPGVQSQVVPNTGLNYFTPAKILDAASVLFNNKAINNNPYVQIDNLSTLFTSASGASSLDPGNLKINVKGCSVQFTMKNVSNRVASVDIWEMTPTLKFQNTNPLNDLVTTVQAWSEATSDTNFQYFLNGANNGNGMFDPIIEMPSIAKKYMGYKFNWKKRSMVLAPDETCIHSIMGPKGIFDFKNIIKTNATSGGATPDSDPDCLFKGWSVGVLISVAGDLVLPTAVSAGGRYLYNAVVGACGMPISVEVKETYRIAVPEVAGYVSVDAAPGVQQQLNLRKPKTIYVNQATIGNVAYTVSNEVNPLDDAAGNQNA